jgi:hypothetical protein
MTSITYHPNSRNDVLNDLSHLNINGQSVHKLESLGTIYVHHRKRVNVFRRFNSVYEILFETDDHTIHFHKNIRVLDSLHQLFGSEMDHLEVMEVFSYKHHGALITHEAFHLPTLCWNELHYTWGGVSMYLESAQHAHEQTQGASPLASPQASSQASPLADHEDESESDAFASPEASRPTIPETPAKQAHASAHTPSVRRCLSDRFTALLQKRTFSEMESEVSDSDSESQEDTCMILRNGTRYPRNLF